MASIDIMLRRSGGTAAGVPLLRHGLALAMLLSGAIEVNARFGTFRLGVMGIVPLAASTMLLAVTGFLLARSAEQQGARSTGSGSRGAMLYRYARRLLPPLVVSLLMTIVVLGLAFSTTGIRSYFGSTETWRYLGNAVGWSSITLPGVFEFNNASATINAWLWMVPVIGLGCLLAGAAAIVPSNGRRCLFVGALAIVVAAALGVDRNWIDAYAVPRSVRPLLDAQALAGFAGIALGMIAYTWRRRVQVGPLFVVAAIVIIAGAARMPRFWVGDALAQSVLAVPLAYIAIALAVARLPTPWPLHKVNYSLGIVLYAYPVEQAWIARYGTDQSLFTNVVLSLPATLLLAAASWHLIERPLLVRLRDEPVIAVMNGGGGASVIRPFGWYVERLRRLLPGAVVVVAFAGVMLALMAIAMVALQRDQPGM